MCDFNLQEELHTCTILTKRDKPIKQPEDRPRKVSKKKVIRLPITRVFMALGHIIFELASASSTAAAY